MPFSDTEPSSAQRVVLKVGKRRPKSAKTSCNQKGWCSNPTKLQISINFNTENFDARKRYESTQVDRRTWLHVLSGTHWSTSSYTHQVVEL